jgi:hypothetical protein
MLAPVRNLLPLTTIQRERLLPRAGRVIARKGQKIAATDVVAEGVLAPRHVLLDIVRGLGVPADQADRFIQRQANDSVEQGDIIAGPVGIGRRVVRAPYNGKIVVVGNGQVLMDVGSRPFELRAGYPGVISDLVADQGVIIETTGALIQGVWGNGRMDAGLMTALCEHPTDDLTASRLDVSMRGAVILGGYVDDPAVLRAASELQLRGLILSSMRADLLPVAYKTTCPVIVVEGFGRMPMNASAFKLLSTSTRRETALVADIWNPYTGTYPEIIIPLPAQGAQPQGAKPTKFAGGQTVRLTRLPHQGSVGTIRDIIPGLTRLESGLQAPAAHVELESGDVIVVALANMEILG